MYQLRPPSSLDSDSEIFIFDSGNSNKETNSCDKLSFTNFQVIIQPRPTLYIAAQLPNSVFPYCSPSDLLGLLTGVSRPRCLEEQTGPLAFLY